jgi:hypothetical protein
MNKIINLFLIINITLSISSCNYNEPDNTNPLLGKWYVSYTNPNNEVDIEFILQFNNDSTYCSYVNGEKGEKGEYIYYSDTKKLYTFNRTFDDFKGYNFIATDTIVEKAYVQNNILYRETYVGNDTIITKYTRY